jgi:hypothetical protein
MLRGYVKTAFGKTNVAPEPAPWVKMLVRSLDLPSNA